MKKFLIVLFLSLSILAQAQKGVTTFSISYGHGKGEIGPTIGVAKMSESYSKGPIKTVDFNLNRAVGKSTSIETGFSILKHRYDYRRFDPPNSNPPENRLLKTLVIPIKLKVDILNYFFIGGGFLLNAEIGENPRLQAGFGIGAGAQYFYKNKYGVFIYPQVNIHNTTVGLAEHHIAYGLAYRFHKN